MNTGTTTKGILIILDIIIIDIIRKVKEVIVKGSYPEVK